MTNRSVITESVLWSSETDDDDDLCQVKSRFVLEADVKTISRQITSILTQVKRERELKQSGDVHVNTAGGSVTSSTTSLPTVAATAVVTATQQTRPAGTQPPGAASVPTSAATSPAAVPPASPAQCAVVENTASSLAPVNGLAAAPASVAVPVAGTLPSVVTAGQTPTVNTVTASVNTATSQQPQAAPSKPAAPLCMLNFPLNV